MYPLNNWTIRIFIKVYANSLYASLFLESLSLEHNEVHQVYVSGPDPTKILGAYLGVSNNLTELGALICA